MTRDIGGSDASVGKFDLLQHVATGGMGSVYKARNRETGETVALKILLPKVAAKPTALERFRHEAQQGLKLRHRHLVAFYDLGEESGRHFLVQEFVDGIDLYEYILREGPLKPAVAYVILGQAAMALDYLHRKNLVHRDIKPSNFLLSRCEGMLVVKLTDFGLIRDVDDEEFRLTKAGYTVGSVNYMAPEQARNSRAADIRSDIYALGCTFYHMLTGRPPFAEGSLAERIHQHANADPPEVRQFNPAVSQPLVDVLWRMLAKKPEDRYQTPQDLIADLTRARREDSAADPGTVAPQPTPAAASLRAGKIEMHAGEVLCPPSSSEVEEASETRATPPVASVTSGQRLAADSQFRRACEIDPITNYEYGIELYLSACKLSPATVRYRKGLRTFARQKYTSEKQIGWLAKTAILALKVKLAAAKQAKDPHRVLEIGEQILAKNPWDVGVQLDLAEAAERLNMLDAATSILELAWTEENQSPRLNRALARLLENGGEFARATELLEKALKLDPDNMEALSDLRRVTASQAIATGGFRQKLQTP